MLTFIFGVYDNNSARLIPPAIQDSRSTAAGNRESGHDLNRPTQSAQQRQSFAFPNDRVVS